MRIAADETAAGDRPGRTCPLAYRYSPRVFDRVPTLHADVLYVVGGLYGNPQALDALFELAAHERTAPLIVFNGDFNWFNRDAAGFAAINDAVLRHVALRGNVETELAGEDDGAGCGCGYPDDVSDAEVERSNAILAELRETARTQSALRARLGALPMHEAAQVGGTRVGIVHGDAESLAGWGFAHDQLDDPANRGWLARVFKEANVDIFASSHTCLPALRAFDFGQTRMVINNGAAGMPNFHGMRSGMITRIAVSPAPHAGLALYGTTTQGVHVDAVALPYDADEWEATFLRNWPAESPGHRSYFQRIRQGPRFTPEEASRGRRELTRR